MLGGGVDAATLVAAFGAGPPPPECRWGRRPHRGATACRLLERDDRGVDGPGVEGDSRLGELLEVERDEGLRAAARVAVMRAVFAPRRLEPGCEELEGRDRVRSGAAESGAAGLTRVWASGAVTTAPLAHTHGLTPWRGRSLRHSSPTLTLTLEQEKTKRAAAEARVHPGCITPHAQIAYDDLVGDDDDSDNSY